LRTSNNQDGPLASSENQENISDLKKSLQILEKA
jgi:hypothetical protein